MNMAEKKQDQFSDNITKTVLDALKNYIIVSSNEIKPIIKDMKKLERNLEDILENGNTISLYLSSGKSYYIVIGKEKDGDTEHKYKNTAKICIEGRILEPWENDKFLGYFLYSTGICIYNEKNKKKISKKYAKNIKVFFKIHKEKYNKKYRKKILDKTKRWIENDLGAGHIIIAGKDWGYAIIEYDKHWKGKVSKIKFFSKKEKEIKTIDTIIVFPYDPLASVEMYSKNNLLMSSRPFYLYKL